MDSSLADWIELAALCGPFGQVDKARGWEIDDGLQGNHKNRIGNIHLLVWEPGRTGPVRERCTSGEGGGQGENRRIACYGESYRVQGQHSFLEVQDPFHLLSA